MRTTGLLEALQKREIAFSAGVKLSKTIRTLIEQIPDQDWVTVADYPDGEEAQLAETVLRYGYAPSTGR